MNPYILEITTHAVVILFEAVYGVNIGSLVFFFLRLSLIVMIWILKAVENFDF